MSDIVRDSPVDLDVIANALLGCHRGRHPMDLGTVIEPVWTAAINHLLDRGDLAAARSGLAALRRAFPASAYFDALDEALADPPGKPRFFVDAPDRDFEVAARPGARTMVILFAAGDDNFIDSAAFMYDALAPFGVHILYLRDLSRRLYRYGIRSFGPSRQDALDSIARIRRALGADRLVCAAASAGGHAALSYGLELGAEAILTFSAYTNYSEFYKYGKELAARRLGREVSKAEFDSLDLRTLYAGAVSPPRIMLVYPADNGHDAEHAANMSGLPTVTLMPVAGSKEHSVQRELIVWGRFSELLTWLIAPDTVAGPPDLSMTLGPRPAPG